MGISRILPRSSAGIDRALTSAKNKNDSLAPADRFFTTQTTTRLNADQPQQQSLMAAEDAARSAQVAATLLVEDSKELAIKFVSHFIQVFDLGIAREKYPRAHRAHYQLPASGNKLPEIRTEQKLTEWVNNVVTGDAARVAAGGAAMSNPTAAEVGTAGGDFISKNIAQSPLKDSYDVSQEALKYFEKNESLGAVKKLWDEVETRYNEEAPSSKRRKAREFGVVYESDVTNTFNIHVQDSASLVGIGGVTTELVETGNTHDTNASGDVPINSKVTDSATFQFTHPDYVTQQVIVPIVDGQTVYNVTVNLVHV